MAQRTGQLESGNDPASLLSQSHLFEFPRQLLVHCVASLPEFGQLAHHVAGVDKYAERALLLARGQDLVCVAHHTSPDYLDFLRQLDIGPHPENIIRLPDDPRDEAVSMLKRLQHCSTFRTRLPELLTDGNELWLNSFAASKLDRQLQSYLTSIGEISVSSINQHPSTHINLYDKHEVRAQARACGLPLPPGESVRLDRNAPTELSQAKNVRRAIEKYLAETGRVIIRGALGASGSSVFVVSGEEGELQRGLRAIAAQRHTDIFLVEPFYQVDVSPNIGMFIDPRDGAISCVSVSDQIMDRRVRHIGNQFPSRAHLVDQMVAAARSACLRLRDLGTTGFLGFDFCEYCVPGSKQRQFFFAELNPRFNGATYPSLLLARLNCRECGDPGWQWSEFRALTMRTTTDSFTELRSQYGDLFFDRQSEAGIIPYNIGLLDHGKLMLAIVGATREGVESICDEVACRNNGAMASTAHPLAAA